MWKACRAIWVGLLLAGVNSCREAPVRPTADTLSTEEVSPPLDRGASIEGDPTPTPALKLPGTDRALLPGGFPPEVPWPEVGGVVDSGPSEGGAWVEWVVPKPIASVRLSYPGQLLRAGFRRLGPDRFQKGVLVVRVDFQPFGSEGTRVRVEPIVPGRS